MALPVQNLTERDIQSPLRIRGLADINPIEIEDC